jgi:hypothetical protein
MNNIDPRRPSPAYPRLCGLRSLWDMLEENARDFMILGQAVYDATAMFQWKEYGGIDDKTKAWRLNEKGEKRLRRILELIKGFCGRLGLPVSQALVDECLKPDGLPQTTLEWNRIVDIFRKEVGAKKCLFIPQHVEQYYEWGDITSEAVLAAFPKASEELRAGGTCLATGAYTACVFHAMRAAEIGLKALGADCNLVIKGNKPIEMAEWREVLDGLSTVVHGIENQPNSTPTKDADLLFYSETCAQFRFFKNGWRVRTAHARATYTEPQAKEAIDHVRSFFEILAPRLKEIGS